MSEIELEGPAFGPCSGWIEAADVATCCTSGDCDDTPLFTKVAEEASQLMFELSARQYPGVCERTVRPCRAECSCWTSVEGRLRSWQTGFWQDECGDTCGCGHSSRILLSYPVREVTEVKIDGVVVDPAAYRLDGWKWLVRVDGGSWPDCQDMAAADTEAGTWSVEYSWGVDPPSTGKSAAAQLACQLYAQCTTGECALPSGATRVTREGVTIERDSLLTFLIAGHTGLVYVDAFLSTYNPHGLRRRSLVWSPDLSPAPRVVGN